MSRHLGFGVLFGLMLAAGSAEARSAAPPPAPPPPCQPALAPAKPTPWSVDKATTLSLAPVEQTCTNGTSIFSLSVLLDGKELNAKATVLKFKTVDEAPWAAIRTAPDGSMIYLVGIHRAGKEMTYASLIQWDAKTKMFHLPKSWSGPAGSKVPAWLAGVDLARPAPAVAPAAEAPHP